MLIHLHTYSGSSSSTFSGTRFNLSPKADVHTVSIRVPFSGQCFITFTVSINRMSKRKKEQDAH